MSKNLTVARKLVGKIKAEKALTEKKIPSQKTLIDFKFLPENSLLEYSFKYLVIMASSYPIKC